MKHQSESSINKAPITVIIPAYNVASCLERAILSALDQSPPPLEVIVINDGSTDRTAEVARSFGDRIRYLEQPNTGPAAARNAGLAAATGKYVAFLDADDYWLPGFIRATVEFMDAHPEAVAVSTGWQIQPLKGPVTTFPPKQNSADIPQQAQVLDNFFDFWVRFDHVRTGTVLMRWPKLSKDGFQRTDLRICEDLEFWAYLASLGAWGFIPEPFWFGDSARVAVNSGWLSRYRIRRYLCPTVELWQKRILPALKSNDMKWFSVIRGRVALIFAHNTILAGRFGMARKIVAAYQTDFPETKSARLLITGNQWGSIFWYFVCSLFQLREHQKSFMLHLKLIFGKIQ